MEMISKRKKTQRDPYWDIIKGFTILLVIIGHSIQYHNGETYYEQGLYWANPIFKFIYSFHMPLFMLISGYFCVKSIQKYNVHDFVKNKTQSLLLPILSYSLIITGYEWSTSGFSIMEFFHNFFANLWFLWAVWLSSLTLYAFKKKNISYKIAYVGTFVVMLLVPDFWVSFAYAKFTFPAFLLGAIVAENNEKYNFAANRWEILITLFIAFLILLPFYNHSCYVYTTKCSLWKKHGWDIPLQVVIDTYRTIIGLVGSMLLLLLMKWITKKWHSLYVWKILSYVGQHTLGIYIFSSLIYDYSVKREFYSITNTSFSVPLSFFMVLFLTLGITIILKQNAITNKLFLGKR